MTVPLLVPRRPDGGRRDRLWRFCRDWWATNTPDFKPVEGLHLGGPFNRAAAINRAAAEAGDWDVAVVADSDVVCDPDQLREAIQQARSTGRMTLPYSRYVELKEAMTGKVLAGFDGNWMTGSGLKMGSHVSSLVVVPRTLWETVGGFDERFVGWGHEDVAFAESCRVLGGGIDRVPGDVWHLHHPHSSERAKSPLLRACAALAARYYQADKADMVRIISERDIEDGVCLVVVTDGRRDCISRTLPAAERRLIGLPVVRRVICDDSADIDYHAWLRHTFPAWDLVLAPKRSGFAGAVRRAWATALASGQRWVFWLEDDFILERDVDLAAMAKVLKSNPNVAQMALRRQAWFPAEIEAGGVVEQNPGAYTDREGWLEHREFWTTNPHLIARSTLAELEWPNKPHSEALFAKQVLSCWSSGYWGARADQPWVTHIGERAGTGY